MELVAGVENRASAGLQLCVNTSNKSSVNKAVKPAKNEPTLDWREWRLGRRNHAVIKGAEQPEKKSAGEDSEAMKPSDKQCRNYEPDRDGEQ